MLRRYVTNCADSGIEARLNEPLKYQNHDEDDKCNQTVRHFGCTGYLRTFDVVRYSFARLVHIISLVDLVILTVGNVGPTFGQGAEPGQTFLLTMY